MHQLRQIVAFGAFASLAFAQPAVAADGATGAAASNTGVSEAAPAKKSARATRYCLNMVPDTASRIARRECRTQQEWSSEGVDVKANK